MPLNGSLLTNMFVQEYQSLGWDLAHASHLKTLCKILGEGIVKSLLDRSIVTITTTVLGGAAGSPGMAQGPLTLTMPQPAWEQSFVAALRSSGWKGKSLEPLVKGLTMAVTKHLATAMILAGPIPGCAAGTALSQIVLKPKPMQATLEQGFQDAKWYERNEQGQPTSTLTPGAKTLSRITASQMALLLASSQTMMVIAGGATAPGAANPTVDQSGYLQ